VKEWSEMMLKVSKEMLLELECGGMLVKGWLSKCEEIRVLKRIKMPWCGVIEEMLCKSIRKNGGLYTQCEKESECEYCVGCLKEKSKNGELKWGSVYDRMKVGIEEYRDRNGNKPLKYRKIMKKDGISMEEVLEEGKRLGWEVPLCHFEENDGKRGRPKKEKSVVEMVEKKKRGRPKKEKEMVSQNAGEDLIASLLLGVGGPLGVPSPYDGIGRQDQVQEKEPSADLAVQEKPSADLAVQEKEPLTVQEKPSADLAVQEKEPLTVQEKEPLTVQEKPSADLAVQEKPSADLADLADEDEEEETCVIKFTIDGKIYLKSDDNVLYDLNTHDAVGVWNEKSNEIDELPDEDDEEE
jgi:hypothetical protein